MFRFLCCVAVLCVLYILPLAAQEKEVEGIVFDKDTQYRINRVSIKNLRTQISIFNNNKAEFSLSVKSGDKIVASAAGYKLDTLVYKGQTAILIYMQRLAIPLQEILIKDSILSARKRYEETRKDFGSLNRLGNDKDLLATGGGTVGLSIDALWSAFSKQGRNARKLTEIMERDYKNNFVDEKFNKRTVSKVTGLKTDRLEVFMRNYRPSYYFVSGASDYDLISYIKMSYIQFRKDPYQEDISLLKPIEE